jgi:hypothetical protein
MNVRLAALPLLGLLATLTACSPTLIPNTQIRDTEDNRAILDIVREYKNAFEAKDAKAIAALASPRYLDARDSVSKETLTQDLEKDFAKVKDIHLDINVRRIETEGNRAHVDYFFSEAFLLASTDQQWQRESDDKRMILERDDKIGWQVLSGF